MRKFWLMLCACFALAGILAAQMPPLVDRDLFFGEIEISGAQLSPNGEYISFLKPHKGTRNVWVKKAGEPFSAAKPITEDTKRPIGGYFWSRDSRFVLYVQDDGGDENFNIYAVNPAEKPAEGADVPKARNLTDVKGVRAVIYSTPKSQPDVIYIGLNDRDKAWHDLYRLNLSTGAKTLLRKNEDRVTGWIFDNKGSLRMATRAAENGDTEVLRVDADKLVKIYSCNVLEGCGPVRFDKENKLVYFETNRGEDVDLTSLMLMDPATGATTLVESDPMKRVDFGSAAFSDRTDEMVMTSYEDDRIRRYWKDKQWEGDYQWLQKQLPNQEISMVSSTADESLMLVNGRADTDPGATYLFDRKKKTLALQYKIREKLPREALSPMKVVRYPSSDGLEISAYLTLPKGLPEKDLPLVVLPHGGPWARDSWGYGSMVQFLANRGYAVLQPNFRGSTGFGKKFLNAGNGEWGQKMQDDITWGVKHLVAQGTVNAKRVAIAGGSYGGYATLAGVAFTPDVYAAGVPIVAPSNLITLLESIPPYWEAARKVFAYRMADMETPEGRKQLERQSPVNSADRIKVPLLVVQGANDPRVKKHESDQIVVAVRDRGLPVEYLVAPDEGHGFARPINNLAMMAAMEKFLARHIDGRYQSEMPAEVGTRLKEITVDPATVTLAAKVDAAAVGIPAIASELSAGVSRFKAVIQAGGQTLPVEISSEVKQEGDTWLVTDIMKTPMGELSDVAILARKDLSVTKRKVNQGPVSIEVDFAGGKASGSMAMGGQQRPVAADTGGPIFADSAGSMQSIAALPLESGYTATFRNFDLQTAKPKLLQLKVTGSESVTVPAGTFEAWKVEISSAEGGADKRTMWVAKESRKTVKGETVLPQMGGVTLTAELLP